MFGYYPEANGRSSSIQMTIFCGETHGPGELLIAYHAFKFPIKNARLRKLCGAQIAGKSAQVKKTEKDEATKYLEKPSGDSVWYCNIGLTLAIDNVGIAIINHPPNHHKWVV